MAWPSQLLRVPAGLESAKVQAQQPSHQGLDKPPVGMVVDISGSRLLAEPVPLHQTRNFTLLAVFLFGVNAGSYYQFEGKVAEGVVT